MLYSVSLFVSSPFRQLPKVSKLWLGWKLMMSPNCICWCTSISSNFTFLPLSLGLRLSSRELLWFRISIFPSLWMKCYQQLPGCEAELSSYHSRMASSNSCCRSELRCDLLRKAYPRASFLSASRLPITPLYVPLSATSGLLFNYFLVCCLPPPITIEVPWRQGPSGSS